MNASDSKQVERNYKARFFLYSSVPNILSLMAIFFLGFMAGFAIGYMLMLIAPFYITPLCVYFIRKRNGNFGFSALFLISGGAIPFLMLINIFGIEMIPDPLILNTIGLVILRYIDAKARKQRKLDQRRDEVLESKGSNSIYESVRGNSDTCNQEQNQDFDEPQS